MKDLQYGEELTTLIAEAEEDINAPGVGDKLQKVVRAIKRKAVVDIHKFELSKITSLNAYFHAGTLEIARGEIQRAKEYSERALTLIHRTNLNLYSKGAVREIEKLALKHGLRAKILEENPNKIIDAMVQIHREDFAKDGKPYRLIYLNRLLGQQNRLLTYFPPQVSS